MMQNLGPSGLTEDRSSHSRGMVTRTLTLHLLVLLASVATAPARSAKNDAEALGCNAECVCQIIYLSVASMSCPDW